MNDQTTVQLVNEALEMGQGVIRLAPNWVPRANFVPGRRLRLHPNDLYAFGTHRGGIDERWFASTTKAENGPHTLDDEGLSYIYVEADSRVTLRDAIGLHGDALLGKVQMEEHGGLVMYSKFFDNMYALPFHVHPDDAYFGETGKYGKPEAYYYPAQYNATQNTFPYTFFGLNPGTAQEQVIDCLKQFNRGDNGILALSRVYRLTLDTGWYVPPGLLHGPGSLCTYEPQRASDVYSLWQSQLDDGSVLDEESLWHDVRQPGDYHSLIDMLDWDANLDPDLSRKLYLEPVPVEIDDDGYEEYWIVYGSAYFSARKTIVHPGRTVTVKDALAYGLICVQGRGTFGVHSIAAPTMIRFSEMTEDEFFVTYEAAQEGVIITNESAFEPLVILKHFNPGYPGMPN